jgi:putative hydrolase of the HAD superfamily
VDRPRALVVDWSGVLDVDPAMIGLVRRAKRAGLATALLSNAGRSEYPPDGWATLFDAVVLSGEVGMRKPDIAIYRYTAKRLGVAPHEAVFVDDLAVNVRGAVAAGMIGVHHVSYERTLLELEAVFTVPLTG